MTVTKSETVSKIILLLTYKTITNDLCMTKFWGQDMSLRGNCPPCPPVATRLSPRPRSLFPLVVVFMVNLGQPQLHAKFEVASCSRCTNIKGNPKILRSFYSTRSRPLFLRCGILWWDLASANFEVASFIRWRNIIGNPKILGSSLAQGHTHFFLWVWFYDRPWQTQGMDQIWSH